jgi:phage tail sheath protein FI
MSEALYKVPGVQVTALTLPNKGPRPIESLATAVLAMVGFYTPKTADDLSSKPVLVTSWAEFTGKYGSLQGTYLHQAMRGYFINGGKRAYVVGIPYANATTKDVPRTADDKPDLRGAFTKGIEALETCEDVTLLACPDVFATVTPDTSGPKGAATGATATTGAQPSRALSDDDVKAIREKMIEHCDDMGDRFAILDLEQDLKVDDAAKWASPKDSRRAAAYYPWLRVPRLDSSAANEFEFVPPSGHLAGMFARVDIERGVHKAPANESILGVTALQHKVTRKDLQNLNQNSVNCILQFPGYGFVSWGARTLSKDALWRYINVQRLVSNISDSITDSIRWAVFEPNGQVLWAALRRDISAYLTRLWRQGALFGKAPGEAFYVKCDESNNQHDAIAEGKCSIEIGIAPVRPAEFIVVQISQWEGGSISTVAGELITGA